MCNVFRFSLFLSFCFYASYGQDGIDSVKVSLEPFVSLRGQLAVFDNQMELQENASNFGGKLNVSKGNLTFIAGLELQLNMFKGISSFNVDSNLSSGFLDIENEQKRQVLGNRYGYLGVSFANYGTLTMGKQSSVYRDVTSYTDKFLVFGSRASATYVGNTDGGENGTGRADQSIIYRNRIGPVIIGAQAQARGEDNDHFIDGFGFSSQFEITDGFLVGLAFNRAFFKGNIVNGGKVLGLTANPTYVSVGTSYVGKNMEFSLVYAMQKNGDFAQGTFRDSQGIMVNNAVVFDANGIEVFGKYKLDKFDLYAGFNYYSPDLNTIPIVLGQSPISKDFKRNDVILGVSYLPFKFIHLYSEGRLSNGIDSMGVSEKSVFVLGMKIDISKSIYKMVSL